MVSGKIYNPPFQQTWGCKSFSSQEGCSLCNFTVCTDHKGTAPTNGSHTRQMLKSREKHHGEKAVRNWSVGEPFCHCEKLLLSTTPECPVFTRVTLQWGIPRMRGGGVRPMSDKTVHSDCTTLVVIKYQGFYFSRGSAAK